jgi:hypothetical protein
LLNFIGSSDVYLLYFLSYLHAFIGQNQLAQPPFLAHLCQLVWQNQGFGNKNFHFFWGVFCLPPTPLPAVPKGRRAESGAFWPARPRFLTAMGRVRRPAALTPEGLVLFLARQVIG